MFDNSTFKKRYQNGNKFLIISKGQPAQTLLCLHGMFGGLSNYDALINKLENCRVIVPSIPIHDLGPQLSIETLTQWLKGFIDELEIDQPILLGNSLGGHLALDYTIKYPDNVQALVLTGSSGLQEKDFGSSCPRRNDREYVRKQAAQTFYQDMVDETLLDDIMDVITDPAKLKNILTVARDTHEYDIERHLPEITQKVLLVWGKNDEITPPEAARKFYEKLPNADLRWIAECGHAPMMEHPETFALFLNEFLIELQNKRKDKSTDYEEDYSHH